MHAIALIICVALRRRWMLRQGLVQVYKNKLKKCAFKRKIMRGKVKKVT
jgi:hypothetical protein